MSHPNSKNDRRRATALGRWANRFRLATDTLNETHASPPRYRSEDPFVHISMGSDLSTRL
jgi:hypothetical protein